MGEHRIRCGDHVYHAGADEEWVVAWADYETDTLGWCGWPSGMARLSDCTLTKAATDEEHAKTLAGVLRSGDSRASHAARLYAVSAHD